MVLNTLLTPFFMEPPRKNVNKKKISLTYFSKI